MTIRAASALRFAGLAAATLLATGCGVFSPAQTNYSFIPADGVPLSIPGLDLRNLLVVSDAKGGPGTVVGQAVNTGKDAVEVQFGLQGGSTVGATVPAYSNDAISLNGSPVVIGSVPEAPGTMVQLIVATREAGQNVVLVPVLPPDRYYSELEISPSPTPSPSSS